eukprot:2359227-Pleurochrysis_carterae.AAC.1
MQHFPLYQKRGYVLKATRGVKSCFSRCTCISSPLDADAPDLADARRVGGSGFRVALEHQQSLET